MTAWSSPAPPCCRAHRSATTLPLGSASRRATRSRCGRSAPASRSGVTARSSASPPSDIGLGAHVHVQNCEMGDFAKDYAYGVDARPTEMIEPPATFQGIRRPDGKIATRNYIGILTSVNCSAHVAGVVADMFRRNPFTGDDPLADYPNVDGVVALTHKTGCGMTQDEPLRAAAPHARRLCPPPKLLPRHRAGPRLRGEPDRRPDGGAAARRPAARRWTSRPWADRARLWPPAWIS